MGSSSVDQTGRITIIRILKTGHSWNLWLFENKSKSEVMIILANKMLGFRLQSIVAAHFCSISGQLQGGAPVHSLIWWTQVTMVYSWYIEQIFMRSINLVGGLKHVLFSNLLGISSSQLTNSYFLQSDWLKPPTSISAWGPTVSGAM